MNLGEEVPYLLSYLELVQVSQIVIIQYKNVETDPWESQVDALNRYRDG